MHNQQEGGHARGELQHAEISEICETPDFRIFGEKPKIANLKLSRINVNVFTALFEFPGCISFDSCKKMTMRGTSIPLQKPRCAKRNIVFPFLVGT